MGKLIETLLTLFRKPVPEPHADPKPGEVYEPVDRALDPWTRHRMSLKIQDVREGWVKVQDYRWPSSDAHIMPVASFLKAYRLVPQDQKQTETK